jgi:hypothetical protein
MIMTKKKHINPEITDPKRDQASLASDTMDNDTQNATADAKISSLDKKLLKDSFDPSYDIDLPADSISLDDKDNEGEQLNEGNLSDDLFGEDLDDGLVREEDDE